MLNLDYRGRSHLLQLMMSRQWDLRSAFQMVDDLSDHVDVAAYLDECTGVHAMTPNEHWLLLVDDSMLYRSLYVD